MYFYYFKLNLIPNKVFTSYLSPFFPSSCLQLHLQKLLKSTLLCMFMTYSPLLCCHAPVEISKWAAGVYVVSEKNRWGELAVDGLNEFSMRISKKTGQEKRVWRKSWCIPLSPSPTHPLMQPPFSKWTNKNNHWLVIYMHSIPTVPPYRHTNAWSQSHLHP